MDRRSLAVCAVFKNEARYLLEWIAYHRVIGFDRFVLYDNGSTDGGADLIRSSPLADRVTVVHWPQRPGRLSAYRHFIDIFAPAYDWTAFIDVQEFILPLDGTTVSDTLQRCAQASAVLVNWRVFGPAGHEAPAPGLVVEAYDLRAEDALPVNRHVKSIVRCADLLDVMQTPHEFRVKGPACNPLGQEVPNTAVQQTPCHHGLVINRYHTRSRREWLARAQGSNAMLDDARLEYTEDMFNHLEAVCHVRDTTIQAYVPPVRALLPERSTSVGATTSLNPDEPAATPAVPGQAWEPVVEPSGGIDTVAAAIADPSWPSRLPAFPTPRRLEPQPATGQAPGTATAQHAAPAPAPAAGWAASGPDAQQHRNGLALVFRDRSRSTAPWLAALRGRAAGLIDPDFLLDESGRLRDFPTDQEARAACEAALTEYQLG